MSGDTKILDMVAEGIINSNEAIELINVLNKSEDSDENTDHENSLKKVRRLFELVENGEIDSEEAMELFQTLQLYLHSFRKNFSTAN